MIQYKRVCSFCDKGFMAKSKIRSYCSVVCYNVSYSQKNKEKLADYTAIYRQVNKDKIKIKARKYKEKHKKRIREWKRDYNKANRKRTTYVQRKWYERNRDKVKQYTEIWKKQNIEKINARRRSDDYKHKRNLYLYAKRNNDILFNITARLRSRIIDFLKDNRIKKARKTMQIVGCSKSYLKEYIENQFQPFMTWDLFLKGEIHIDHIVPLASAKTEEEVYELCHYTNLQPLWAMENMKKGCKII